jgi:hypothetical protein
MLDVYLNNPYAMGLATLEISQFVDAVRFATGNRKEKGGGKPSELACCESLTSKPVCRRLCNWFRIWLLVSMIESPSMM